MRVGAVLLVGCLLAAACATTPPMATAAPTISMAAAETAAIGHVDSTTPIVVTSAELTTYRATNLGSVVSGDTPVWEVVLAGTFVEACGTPTVSPGPQGSCSTPTQLVVIDARTGDFIEGMAPYPS